MAGWAEEKEQRGEQKNRHKLKRIWEQHNNYTRKCRGEEAMNQKLDDPDLNMIINLTRIMTVTANDFVL